MIVFDHALEQAEPRLDRNGGQTLFILMVPQADKY